MFETLLYWHWFAVALVFLIAEMIGAAGFLLWTGISAAIIGIVTWIFPTLDWRWQLVAFSAITLVVLWFWRRHLQQRLNITDQPMLNKRADGYVGRTTVLVQAIEHGRGYVSLDDSHWQVSGPDLPVGTAVKIVAAEEGMLLKVEAVDE